MTRSMTSRPDGTGPLRVSVSSVIFRVDDFLFHRLEACPAPRADDLALLRRRELEEGGMTGRAQDPQHRTPPSRRGMRPFLIPPYCINAGNRRVCYSSSPSRLRSSFRFTRCSALSIDLTWRFSSLAISWYDFPSR